MPTKCTDTTAKGLPCKAWAVAGTTPARCAAHGGAAKKPGAPAGNTNAKTHGFYATANQEHSPTTITGIIDDLAHKQTALSDYLAERIRDKETPLDFKNLAAAFDLHARTASRLGRLLSTKHAISGEASDGLAGAIAQALDELSVILGTQL